MPFKQGQKHNPHIIRHSKKLQFFLKCTNVCTGIDLADMINIFKKHLDIHSRGKSDKNGIFDIVTSCSIFDNIFF